MTSNRIRKATQEPLNAEERELMDPDSWDWDNATPGETVGTPGAIIELRFSREEIAALGRLAQAADLGPVEFARRTLLRYIASEQDKDHSRQVRRPA